MRQVWEAQGMGWEAWVVGADRVRRRAVEMESEERTVRLESMGPERLLWRECHSPLWMGWKASVGSEQRNDMVWHMLEQNDIRYYVGHKVEQTRGTHTQKAKMGRPRQKLLGSKDRTVPWARMVAVHVVIWSQTADVFWRQNPQGEQKSWTGNGNYIHISFLDFFFS